jgi:hypothetical protein
LICGITINATGHAGGEGWTMDIKSIFPFVIVLGFVVWVVIRLAQNRAKSVQKETQFKAGRLIEDRGFNFPAHRNLRVSEGVENLLR